jgi:hypothetical protein
MLYKPGMVIVFYNLTTCEVEAGDYEFNTSPGYIVRLSKNTKKCCANFGFIFKVNVH